MKPHRRPLVGLDNPRAKDERGNRYGMLVVVAGPTSTTRAGGGCVWLCRCDCGRLVRKRGNELRYRDARHSCGCRRLRHRHRPAEERSAARRAADLKYIGIALRSRGRLNAFFAAGEYGKIDDYIDGPRTFDEHAVAAPPLPSGDWRARVYDTGSDG